MGTKNSKNGSLKSGLDRLKQDLRCYASAYLVLLLSLATSLTLALLAQENVESRLKVKFQNLVTELTARITYETEAHIRTINQIRAFFEMRGNVTRDDFRLYLARSRVQLEVRGAQGVGYAPRISQTNLEEHLRAMRRTFPQYEITPDYSRAEYFPIIMLEPFDWRNQRAFGYDMFTETKRQGAMRRARDLGDAQMTVPLRLVQETEIDPQLGFLIYVPVYDLTMPRATVADRQKAFKGFVYRPYRSRDFFNAVMNAEKLSANKLDIEVFDITAEDQPVQLFDIFPEEKIEENDSRKKFHQQGKLELGGRKWQIAIQARPEFFSGGEHVGAGFAGLGAAISLLLFRIFRGNKNQELQERHAREAVEAEKQVTDSLYRKLQEELRQRQKAEEEVRLLNRDLENRVKERTAQLEAANKDLEAFSYSVSHDLRAPLRSIEGFSGILLSDYQNNLDDRFKNYLQRVRQAAIRMSTLIDHMLTLSHVARVELNTVTVNLSEIAVSIKEELGASVGAHGVSWTIEPNLKAEGDPVLLRSVLENLLGNALKFSLRAPHPTVEFGCFTSVNRSPVYYVKDNGAGFDMRYVDKLFKPFQRLHSLSEYEGTGVGLATVYKIIRRLGGRVWAQGEPGEGAVIYFTLWERDDTERRATAERREAVNSAS